MNEPTSETIWEGCLLERDKLEPLLCALCVCVHTHAMPPWRGARRFSVAKDDVTKVLQDEDLPFRTESSALIDHRARLSLTAARRTVLRAGCERVRAETDENCNNKSLMGVFFPSKNFGSKNWVGKFPSIGEFRFRRIPLREIYYSTNNIESGTGITHFILQAGPIFHVGVLVGSSSLCTKISSIFKIHSVDGGVIWWQIFNPEVHCDATFSHFENTSGPSRFSTRRILRVHFGSIFTFPQQPEKMVEHPFCTCTVLSLGMSVWGEIAFRPMLRARMLDVAFASAFERGRL